MYLQLPCCSLPGAPPVDICRPLSFTPGARPRSLSGPLASHSPPSPEGTTPSAWHAGRPQGKCVPLGIGSFSMMHAAGGLCSPRDGTSAGGRRGQWTVRVRLQVGWGWEFLHGGRVTALFPGVQLLHTTQPRHRTCPQNGTATTRPAPRHAHTRQFACLHTHARGLWPYTHVRAWLTCTHAGMLTPVHVHGAGRVWGEAGDQGSG